MTIRFVRLFPTRQRAILCADLPILEAAAIHLADLKPRIHNSTYRANFRYFVKLAKFTGPVRLRSCRPTGDFVKRYTAARKAEGARVMQVQREVLAYLHLWRRCYTVDAHELRADNSRHDKTNQNSIFPSDRTPETRCYDAR